jgi:hypothetical protein
VIGRGVDDSRIFHALLVIGRRKRGIAENFGKTEDGVERGAQLVAHVGEQAVLQRFFKPRLFPRPFQFGGEIWRRPGMAQHRNQPVGLCRAGGCDLDRGETFAPPADPRRRNALDAVRRDGGQVLKKARAVPIVDAIDQAVAHQLFVFAGKLRPALALDESHPSIDAMMRHKTPGARERSVAFNGNGGQRAAGGEGGAEHGGQRKTRRPFGRRRDRADGEHACSAGESRECGKRNSRESRAYGYC